jgi:membrane-bound lytic murein transglycosylase
MSGTMDWKVDVANYMGHKYEQYKNKLNAKAMTKPSAYYETQSKVMEELNETIAQEIYQIFYDLLTVGKLPKGGQLRIDGAELQPSWPSQAATKFALEASNEIDAIITKCVEIILPKSILDISRMQMAEKSKTLGIE